MSDSPSNNRLVGRSILVAIGMFGFGFALVPLYDIICDVTGLNGKTGTVTAEQAQVMTLDESREIVVEFTGGLNESMPWEFRPAQYSMKVHPGGVYEAEFIARNKTDRDMVGQATPSVAPGAASKYFNKTECFCFTNQPLKAGEEQRMPLRFIVDPGLPKHIKRLTLAYTFFDVTDKVASAESGLR